MGLFNCSKCGASHSRFRSRTSAKPASYCSQCHAAHMRVTRPKHSELTEEQRFKANARSYANTYQNRNLLIKQPCKICGDPNAQKHHEDYHKPLEIIWLCSECHINYHYESMI